MLVLKEIKYKNFMSTGNQFTTIQLDTHKTTIVTGVSGAGKSSIISAIFFALYGKPFNKVNKDSLLNTINRKALITELSFSQNNINFLVRRGVKPNIFEIYENDNLIDMPANVRDYQNILNSILRIDEKTFRQIIVMGSTSYVPFMKLPTWERRIVIEDILNIDIFSQMNIIAKERYNTISSSLTLLDSDLKHNNMKLDMLNDLTNNIKSECLNDIKQYDEKIKEIKKNMKTHLDSAKSQKQYIADAESKFDVTNVDDMIKHVKKCDKQLNSLQNEIKRQEKEKTLFDNNVCPTCTQNILEDFANTKKADFNKNIENFNLQSKELQIEHDEIIEKLNTLKQSINKINELKKEYDNTINLMKNLNSQMQVYETEKIASENKLKEISDTKNDEKDLCLTTINDIEKKINDIKAKINGYETIISLLKDDGIKSVIIKSYIGTINFLLKKYIDMLDFNVTFTFDENFNETIKSRNRDVFEYFSLSAGERIRLDFALLFAFREIAKLRSSIHTNLLIIDEIVDGQIDSENIAVLVEMFNKIDANVIIMTHNPENYNSVADRTVFVKKQHNFSIVNEI